MVPLRHPRNCWNICAQTSGLSEDQGHPEKQSTENHGHALTKVKRSIFFLSPREKQPVKERELPEGVGNTSNSTEKNTDKQEDPRRPWAPHTGWFSNKSEQVVICWEHTGDKLQRFFFLSKIIRISLVSKTEKGFI